ncbi:diguanylate cyclase [Roseibium salinum]|nr:diguanylate cyclase [Roseibium salinum]
MIVVVLVSMLGVFGVMHWSARISDGSAEQSQQTLVAGALELTRNYMTKQQTGVVIWEEAYHLVNQPSPDPSWIYNNMTNWLFQNHGFTKSLLVGTDFQVQNAYSSDNSSLWLTEGLVEELKPAVAKVRARYINSFGKKTPSGLYRFAPPSGEARRSIAETGVVSIRGEPYLFTAAAVVPQILSITEERRPPTTLVSLVPLRGEKLAEISEVSRLDGVVLTNAQENRTGVGRYQLRSPDGTNVGIIAWQANLPGSQMLERINPFLAIAAIMISILVIAVTVFTRQMTKRLARSEKMATHAARHDALSGLPNRSRFHALLSDVLENGFTSGTNTAVVYIDLDHFKDINDTLGHSAGDKVIVAVAQRLKRVVPEGSIVARISGDEFTMVIKNCESDEWLEYILDQVQDEIGRPVMIGSRELFASLSMGVAIAPRDGSSPDELLRRADIALYDAKANGRSRRSFFEQHMEHNVQSKDRLSRDLRLALKKTTCSN